MSDFDKCFNRIIHLEFANKYDALHKNDGENGLTYMGIYQSAHPTWIGWGIIKNVLQECNNDLRKASEKLYNMTSLYSAVGLFYDKEFYSKMRLHEINSQQIVDELFCGAINYGIKVAVKLAQRVVGVIDDGIIGQNTIKALNNYDAKKFDIEFDKLEIKHYESLVVKKPYFKRFINGWKNRAVLV